VTLLSGTLVNERFGLPVLPSVSSRAVLAWCLAWQGRFEEALPLVTEGMGIAQAAQHPASLASANVGLGLTCLIRGDLATAVPTLERGVGLYRSLHHRVPAALSFLASAYALTGRVDESLPLFEQSLDMAAAMKFLPCNSVWIVWAGEACLLGNRPEEARDHAARALELARVQKEPAYEAYALHLFGMIGTGRDRPDLESTESRYREAMVLAERLGLRPLVARCHLGLATLHRRSGDRARATQHLTAATEMLRAMDMRVWLEQAEAEVKLLA
jgi:ATP/maltotriose-dependent transcriptional regulator MalT